METSWQNITRRLDINKVSRDTTYDKSRSKGRIIKKVPTDILVPAHTVVYSTNGPRIIAQYNYRMSHSFRVLNYKDIAIAYGDSVLYRFAVAIRYRQGEIVHRYRLSKFDIFASNLSLTNSSAYCTQGFPQYNGEQILPNFSVEIWINQGTDIPPFAFPKGMPTNLTLRTNLLNLPADVDDIGSTITYTEALYNFSATFPENYPMSYPAGTEGEDNI